MNGDRGELALNKCVVRKLCIPGSPEREALLVQRIGLRSVAGMSMEIAEVAIDS